MSYEAAAVREAAQGRAVELLERVAGIPVDYLDSRHHPCPRCGGEDRFRLIDAEAGSVICNQCFSQKNGDFLAAIQWTCGVPFGQAVDLAGEYLGLPPRKINCHQNGYHTNGNGKPADIIARVCKAKRMPLEAFRQFKPIKAKRGKWTVARVPAYGPDWKVCSHFDLTAAGKGWFAKGKPAGMFLPGRRPEPGETWLLVEGVKDAAALVALGYNAAGMPTCKLHEKFAPMLAGCHVALVPDLDTAGQKGAETTAARLAGVAASVKIARLPGEMSESNGADVRDVLAMENGEQLLRAAIDAAEPWTGEPGQEEGAQGPVPITNFEEYEQDDGQKGCRPLPINSIIANLRQRCDDWPRRCGPALFVHENLDRIDWLDSPAALFGWLQARTGIVEWKRGSGFTGKDELYHELRRTATEYAAVETFPNEPPMAGHYYACPMPEPGDGSALAGLLERFAPETEIDRDLIQAFAMTLLWGGPGGCRPAFIFTADAGRGVGKTTVPAVFGHLLGGLIDFAAGDKIAEIKARLLSEEAATKRLALLDNVKSLRFSWAELEALVTAPVISGKRMYVGEASRPNLLTWAITVNGASLSTDLAQRAVIIKLRKPEHSPRWREETFAYVEQHRERLIADLIGALQAEREELRQASRWGTWEWDILARLPEPNEAARVIAERRAAVDVEGEESGIVEEFFAQQIADLNYGDSDRVFIPSRVAAKWWSEATGDRGATVTAAMRQIKQKIDEGSITNVAVSPSRARGRGFIWLGDGTNQDAATIYDIETRIAHREKR